MMLIIFIYENCSYTGDPPFIGNIPTNKLDSIKGLSPHDVLPIRVTWMGAKL